MGFSSGFNMNFAGRSNRRGGGAAGGAPSPTADAGGDQQQMGLTQVTLEATGSGAGSTLAWTLFDPTQTNKSSILSSTTAISPTFHPISSSASAGDWTANLSVTKAGKTSYNSVNIRVGDVDGWITLFPDDAQQASASQTPYGTLTWGRTADWTTVAIEHDAGGTVQYPKQFETKWYTLGVDWSHMTAVEFMLEGDDSVTQPTNAEKVYLGALLTTGSSTIQTVIPGETLVQSMMWFSNKSETTKFSTRNNDQALAFGASSTGYNGFRMMYIKDFYDDDMDWTTYQKLDTVDPNNTNMSTGGQTISPTATDKVKIAMAVGRSAAGEAVTAKFKLKYRMSRRLL